MSKRVFSFSSRRRRSCRLGQAHNFPDLPETDDVHGDLRAPKTNRVMSAEDPRDSFVDGMNSRRRTVSSRRQRPDQPGFSRRTSPHGQRFSGQDQKSTDQNGCAAGIPVRNPERRPTCWQVKTGTRRRPSHEKSKMTNADVRMLNPEDVCRRTAWSRGAAARRDQTARGRGSSATSWPDPAPWREPRRGWSVQSRRGTRPRQRVSGHKGAGVEQGQLVGCRPDGLREGTTRR